MSDAEIPVLASVTPNPEPSEAALPSVVVGEGQFALGEFVFPLPQTDENNRIVASALLDTLLIAMASSSEKSVRNMLKQSKVEIRDVRGKVYFPGPQD